MDRHEVAWELFFAGFAVVFVALAFVPVEPGSDQERALETLEWVITGVFAAEFFSRLWAAVSRRAYVRAHAVDLISLVPPARWLRPFRLLRLLRLVRTFAGVGRALHHVDRLAHHQGLISLLLGWLAVMGLCSVGLYIAENGLNAAVASPLDAFWWGITTMTTVGYGDVYPITPEGRIAAIVLMILGIGLYSAITATLTSVLIAGDRTNAEDLPGKLEPLADLHSAGRLTDAEFIAAKTSVLGDQ